MWRRFVGRVVPDVSKDFSASISRSGSPIRFYVPEDSHGQQSLFLM